MSSAVSFADVSVVTTSAFLTAREAYETAVNARNVAAKLSTDYSAPPALRHGGEEGPLAEAEGKVAACRLYPYTRDASSATCGKRQHAIASDCTDVLGHVPVGYARGDAGGVYTHPRLSDADTDNDNNSTALLGPLRCNVAEAYLAHRVAAGAIDVRGRTVVELCDASLSSSSSSHALDDSAAVTAVPSIAAHCAGARANAVLICAGGDSADASSARAAATDAAVESCVWAAQRRSGESEEAGEEKKTEAIATTESTTAPVGPPSSTNFTITRSFALGTKADVKAALKPVHNVGYDILLAALPSSVTSGGGSAAAVVEGLLASIACLIAKDRTAAAYVSFASFDANEGGGGEEEMGALLDANCGLLGLDFAKIDEAVVAPTSTAAASTLTGVVVVHCFKLFLRLDEAGLPLDPLTPFDAVLQGTGMSESFLSAALARAGRSVLHLDAGANYGGAAFASLDVGAFHRQFCLPLRRDGSYGDGHRIAYGAAVGENCFHDVKASLKANTIFPSPIPPQEGEEGAGEEPAAVAAPLLTEREVRQTIIDAVPLYAFARGPLINTLVDGRAGRNLEFMAVDRVALIEPCATTASANPSTTTTAPEPPAAAPAAAGGLAARRALLAAKKLAKSATDTVAAAATAAVVSAATGGSAASAGAASASAAAAARPGDTFTAKLVPFSRADVFKGGNHLFSNPLEARRAMRFFKDLEKSFEHTAEDSGNENELDKRVECAKEKEKEAREGESAKDVAVHSSSSSSAALRPHRVLCADGETMRRALPWEEPSQDPMEPLEAFLARHYGLSEATIDLLTMGGALVPATAAAATSSGNKQGGATAEGIEGEGALAASINLVRTSLASVGRFGVGDTPLLCPMYGAGEVPQNMCRIAAVWDATFVLRRCVRGVEVCASSGDANAVLLSNGQRVRTRAVALPREIAEYRTAAAAAVAAEGSSTTVASASGGLFRAVMVLSQPLLSWRQLEARCNDHPPADDAAEGAQQRAMREANRFPILLGILRAKGGHEESTSQPHPTPIVIHQIGASTGHAPHSAPAAAPNGLTVLHFTADSASLSRVAFEAAVESLIVEAVPDATTTTTECPTTRTEGGEEAEAPPSPHSILRKSLLYFATFELASETVAAESCGGAAAYRRRLLPLNGAAAEGRCNGLFATSSLLIPSAAASAALLSLPDGDSASSSKEVRTLRASAVPSLLNDGSYVCEAVALYNSVMGYLNANERRGGTETNGSDDDAVEGSADADDAGRPLDPHAARQRAIRRRFAKSERGFMPFLYKLPDPTGRGSDDSGSDSDGDTHASYAQRLLSDARSSE